MWRTGWTKGCRYRSQTTRWRATSSLGTTTVWGTTRTGRSSGCPWRPSSTSASLRPATWWVHNLAAWLGLWLVGCDGVLVGWLVVEVFCQWCGHCVGDVVSDLSVWLWLWLTGMSGLEVEVFVGDVVIVSVMWWVTSVFGCDCGWLGVWVGSGGFCRWCGGCPQCLAVTVDGCFFWHCGW